MAPVELTTSTREISSSGRSARSKELQALHESEAMVIAQTRSRIFGVRFILRCSSGVADEFAFRGYQVARGPKPIIFW